MRRGSPQKNCTLSLNQLDVKCLIFAAAHLEIPMLDLVSAYMTVYLISGNNFSFSSVYSPCLACVHVFHQFLKIIVEQDFLAINLDVAWWPYHLH